MKYFTTIEELENCIGKFIYLYRTDDGKKNGNVVYAWAKKITRIKRETGFKDPHCQIRYHHIYGTDEIVFEDNQRCIKQENTPQYRGRKEKHSNAQQFARELTITEKLLYRIFLKRQEAIEKGLIKIKSQDDN